MDQFPALQGKPEGATLALRLAASIVAAGLAFWIGRGVYLGQPVTTDENGYLFQADTFNELRLSRPVPEPDCIYQRRMMILDERTGWISRYPPGHALWLTPAVWLGDARLASALAAGLSVWFLTGCAALLGCAAWPIAVFLLICPYFLFMHGTLLSHTSGMLAVSVMLWGYLRWRQLGRGSGAAVAGLAWGMLFLNRTYTAVLVAVPFALDSLFVLWRRPTLRQWALAALFAGCAFLGVAAYLFYNHLITGSAFMPPYVYYDDNMLPGFGGPMRHSWGLGFENLAANLTLLDRWLLLGGSALWLFGLLTMVGWTARWSLLALGGIAMVVAGYFLFAHPGVNTCGPFYYFETLPFFALLWILAGRRLAGGVAPARRRVAALIAVAGLAAAGFFSYRFMWDEAGRIVNDVSERARLGRVLATAPSNSLVIVEDMDPDIITDFLVFNQHGAASDPLLFVGIGEMNPIIIRGLTNRAAFSLRPETRDRLTPITNGLALSRRIAWHDIQHITGSATGPGDAEGTGRRARAPDDKPGYLAMGHYMVIPPGQFTACFDVEVARAAESGITAAIEVCAEHGRRILARREITGLQPRAEIRLPLETGRFTEIEPRVFFYGGDVIFRGFSIADRN